MNLAKTGFRAIYHNFVVFPIVSQIQDVLEGFPGAEGANAVLGYGYYDREDGLMVEVLAAAIVDGARTAFSDSSDVRSSFPMEDMMEEEFMILKDGDGKMTDRFSNKLDLLNNLYNNPELERSRAMTIMDDCRNPLYIDDVKVMIMKKGMNPEYVWVRVSGLGPNYVKGTLLTEPFQRFGFAVGDQIGFFFQELSDKKYVAITDLNMGVNLTRGDLADGKMLEAAVVKAKNEKGEATLFELMELLRDSFVFVPFEKPEEDEATASQSRIINFGRRKADIERELEKKANAYLIPRGDVYYLPVFSSTETLGNFAQDALVSRKPFLEAIQVAKECEKKTVGLVLNPFTEPFVVDEELCSIIQKFKSRISE